MKFVRRALLLLFMAGLAALTLSVEESRRAQQAALARAQGAAAQSLSETAVRQAREKRLRFYQAFYFEQYPQRLGRTLAALLCQAGRAAPAGTRFSALSAQAEGNGLRFTLAGTVRAATPAAAAAAARFFLAEMERLAAPGQPLRSESRPGPGDSAAFAVAGTLELE